MKTLARTRIWLMLGTGMLMAILCLWRWASLNPVSILRTHQMMTKDLGRVVITASTPEEFVEQSILIAMKRGHAYPSVIVKSKAGSAALVFNREHASLRDLLCFAADAAHLDYKEYVGRVVLGEHRHPLLPQLESQLPDSLRPADPFQPPK